MLNADEYARLKARTLSLPRKRLDYLHAFIDGWCRAKGYTEQMIEAVQKGRV
jgi:hypothetical protein